MLLRRDGEDRKKSERRKDVIEDNILFWFLHLVKYISQLGQEKGFILYENEKMVCLADESSAKGRNNCSCTRNI